MNELLSVIVTWLTYSVGLPANYEHPEILVVTHEAMLESIVREAQMSASGQGLLARAENANELQLYGFYSDLTRKIYLEEQWSASSIENVSLLVHEMTHHLQSMSSISYACKEEREKIAYEAQARWLEQSGLDLETSFELDPMTLLLRTRCMH